MSWRPWHAWYWKVFLLLKAVTYAFAVAFIVLVTEPKSFGLRHRTFLTAGLAIACTAYVVWGCWVCPWLSATRPILAFFDEPKKLLRGLRICAWTPAIVLDLIVAMMGFDVADGGHIKLHWVIGMISAAVGLNVWCWWWSGRLKPAWLATSRRLHRCSTCGYDLRTNPDQPCPECGEPRGAMLSSS